MIKRANNTVKSGQPPTKRPTEIKHTKKQQDNYTKAYQEYFISPADTPDHFRILDLTEGHAVSYSTHT